MQRIPPLPFVVKDGDLTTNEVDRRWLHFNDYVIQDMDLAPYPDACVEQYMEWFRFVSYSYVIHMAKDDHMESYLQKHLHTESLVLVVLAFTIWIHN